MGKINGLGGNLYVAGYDLSGDTGAINNASTPRPTTAVTGIDKSAIERLHLHKDGQLSVASWFNDANDAEHEAWSSLPTTDRIVTYAVGTTLGDASYSMVGKQINYDGSRNQDGSLTFSVDATANGYGGEWGVMLTAGKRTDTSATSPATGVDVRGAAASFGLQAYCHIFSLGSGTPTIKLQESSEVDGAIDTFADVTGGAFTINSAQTSERIQTTRALAVERYLRVVTTGTFTNLVFVVAVRVNGIETLY